MACLVDVSLIYYSENNVYDHFEDGRSVFELTVQLLLGEHSIESLEPMRVFQKGSDLYSLDNTRLFAMKSYHQVLQRLGALVPPLRVPVVFASVAKSGFFWH